MHRPNFSWAKVADRGVADRHVVDGRVADGCVADDVYHIDVYLIDFWYFIEKTLERNRGLQLGP
jgi:hypothetical protein